MSMAYGIDFVHVCLSCIIQACQINENSRVKNQQIPTGTEVNKNSSINKYKFSKVQVGSKLNEDWHVGLLFFF